MLAIKEMQKSPALYGELYRYFLKRIKTNFHFVLNYSPTGENFKERLLRHKMFLTCCTVVWIQEYNQESLEDLGRHFIQYSETIEKTTQTVMQKTVTEYYEAQMESKRIKELEEQQNNKILKTTVRMYLDAKQMAKKFFT